jgi:hypothetical protein
MRVQSKKIITGETEIHFHHAHPSGFITPQRRSSNLFDESLPIHYYALKTFSEKKLRRRTLGSD